jgi:hypothetical protein
MDIDIASMIAGLPNFLGLIFAIIVLREQNMRLSESLERLIDVIVKRENCE